ncbi:putative transcriptional regulator [Frankia canadensis]|uniref:Putative transcriptional regulator n=1 Tax=Frankia canadensis TaxID=1836972 RepID=A0A2I2KS02_9ACTN|nr:BlaI/MecI/CopY family transcriptional regulator [Frankia canadensis]SNQ48440.1 putative transcriptional regulator [Frankia canadensis]SOU55730.1 putative transcriptional regulator [Frankia canadensis]
MARLGDLERSVMDVLWSSDAWSIDGWLTAREVAARLDHERDLAYTTVLTVLERLERKGFVRRQRAARAHRYAAADSREAVVAEAMMEALGTADDRGSALVRFVGSVSAEEAEILRRALEPAAAGSVDPDEPAPPLGDGPVRPDGSARSGDVALPDGPVQ